MHDIGVIVLAAGSSTRMGAPKQMLTFEGKTLLRRSAETAVASQCRPIVVVLGAHNEACAPELEGLPVRTALNTNWNEGMGASLRVGLEALLEGDTPSAVLIMVCDQPLLTVGILDGLVAAFHKGSILVASQYADAIGVPALFSRELFPELLELHGDQGARSVIQRHRTEATLLPFPGAATDIDTPAEYAHLGRGKREERG